MNRDLLKQQQARVNEKLAKVKTNPGLASVQRTEGKPNRPPFDTVTQADRKQKFENG